MEIKEKLMHTYALACAWFLLYAVYYTLQTFQRYTMDRINSRYCCRILNKITPIKTLVHLHYPFILLLNGYDTLFLIHVPLMIWSWICLPTVMYYIRDIEQPRKITWYRRNLTIQLLLFCLASCFHLIPISGILFIKVLEWEMIWDEQLRAFSDRVEELLFGNAMIYARP